MRECASVALSTRAADGNLACGAKTSRGRVMETSRSGCVCQVCEIALAAQFSVMLNRTQRVGPDGNTVAVLHER